MRHLKTYNESFAGVFKKTFNLERSFIEWFEEDILVKKLKNDYSTNMLDCTSKKIKNLNGIEKFTNLTHLWISHNKLKNLNGIENCKNLQVLYCGNNLLKNLDGIEKLPNLQILNCCYNPWEYPLPIEIVNKFKFEKVYGVKDMSQADYGNEDLLILLEVSNRFRSYDFQKMFLTKFPEKVEDLKPFGFHDKIKEEFPSLVVGLEWGFFDLENNI